MECVEQQTHYTDILNEFFLIRKELNPNYSLRSYARDLNLPSSTLSSIIKKKKGLSRSSAEKIAQKLKFSDNDRDFFINLVLASDARSKKEKLMSQKKLREYNEKQGRGKRLHEDFLKLISDWYYYAILELINIEGFVCDHEWMADKLGISVSEVEQAVKRLINLHLVQVKDGKYKTTGKLLNTTDDIPSYSLKKHASQIMRKSSQALLSQPPSEREFSSLTMGIHEDEIDFVKDEIRAFSYELEKKILEKRKNKKANTVYCLMFQFFNLLRRDTNE